jgi:hypothetical protein
VAKRLRPRVIVERNRSAVAFFLDAERAGSVAAARSTRAAASPLHKPRETTAALYLTGLSLQNRNVSQEIFLHDRPAAPTESITTAYLAMGLSPRLVALATRACRYSFERAGENIR